MRVLIQKNDEGVRVSVKADGQKPVAVVLTNDEAANLGSMLQIAARAAAFHFETEVAQP